MEEFGSEIALPTMEQIIDINRRMIDRFGGNFSPPSNLRNRDPLLYILDAVSTTFFGHELFPSMKGKAAALAFEIIAAHVFVDGNKRTGIHLAWEFLRSNGVPIYLDASVEDMAVNIAKKNATRDDLLEWLHNHQEEP